jgi:hypothetical protein
MWRHGAGLVAIDVRGCDSADDVEKTLQDVLREVQSPLVARTETQNLGDTTYVAPGGDGVYLLRASLVMRASSWWCESPEMHVGARCCPCA